MDLDSATDTAGAGASARTTVGGLGSSRVNLMDVVDEGVLLEGVAGVSAQQGTCQNEMMASADIVGQVADNPSPRDASGAPSGTFANYKQSRAWLCAQNKKGGCTPRTKRCCTYNPIPFRSLIKAHTASDSTGNFLSGTISWKQVGTGNRVAFELISTWPRKHHWPCKSSGAGAGFCGPAACRCVSPCGSRDQEAISPGPHLARHLSGGVLEQCG